MPPSRSIYRALIFPLLILVFVLQKDAKADKVDKLINQLTNSDDYKVRLSAALNLKKLKDKRAIPAFIKALDDDDKTVRGVAASALGSLIKKSTKSSTKKKALAKLKKVAANDGSKTVRKQADKAYKKIKALDGSGAGGGGSGIYVNVGAMSDDSGSGSSVRKQMRKTAVKTLNKKASSWATEWSGGKDPTKKQLKAKGTEGYHIDGTIVSLTEKKSGSSVLVECKVSMLLATYPEKSMFGFLEGGAKVQASSSAQDIKYAKEDCVVAVVEDLIAKKIIPTIKTRSGK
jgi:hypothetical protein